MNPKTEIRVLRHVVRALLLTELEERAAPARIDAVHKAQLVTGLTPRCRVCRCTEFAACKGGCAWVEYDLCSACQKLAP